MSGLIDRPERKGFVRRTRDTRDRHRVIVEIGHDGIAGFGALSDDFVQRLGELHATHTDEQLHVILDFLRKSAEAYREATAGLAE
ncbi:hypothetical protein ACQPYK_34090 [Streptosporangium sp. CA-135522]|uniref:hypothetical protein n=1 Tax=Streptosporangium sp. CA-135522 TaxID=3240072 RepID=UPI003D8E6886